MNVAHYHYDAGIIEADYQQGLLNEEERARRMIGIPSSNNSSNNNKRLCWTKTG